MKAVCVLLCVALARDISGSIFQRRHRPDVSRYYVESSENINQYQHPRYQQKDKTIVIQHKEAEQRQYQLKNSQERQYRDSEEHLYRRTESEQPQFRKEFHSVKTPVGYDQQIVIQKDLKRQQNQVPVINRYADSQSQEDTSYENIAEKLHLQGANLYAQPKFADVNTPVTMMKKNQDVLFGDAVVWRGIRLAADPKIQISEKDIEKIYSDAQTTIKHIEPDTKAMLHKTLEIAIEANDEDTLLNATQLLKKYQYPVEEHTVKTEDGYLLTLHHIPPKQMPREVKPRPVVFLMHGLLGSADDWLLMGPQNGLAYLLSEAGFDVWLGNARGSKYSHHVNKYRVNDDFWQFSNDEIALFDLPAMIDYVLQTSNQEKMIYIGHSAGTTAFFALAAARPVYNDKIVMMYALAPMVYMSNVRSPMMRLIAPTSQLYERLHEQLGHGEFNPSKEVVSTLGGEMCQNEIECKHLCSNVYVVMTGANVEHLDISKIPTILSHLPAGASTRQMKQFGQAVASREFRMYDYGSERNIQVYGEIIPPKYDMTAVTAPVALYFSEADWLAHPKDVKRLQNELPNVTEAFMVPHEYFTNMDFQFSNQALDVYHRLINSIQKNYSY